MPFHSIPGVVGDTALNHSVSPLIARNDVGREVAAPGVNVTNATKLKTCNSSSLMIRPRTHSSNFFAAIRHTPSRVSNLAASKDCKGLLDAITH